MSDKGGIITLLDVKWRPFRPVTVVLEEGGLEPVEWLIEKAEEILTKIGIDPESTVSMKVRVTKLIVGDMEIVRTDWGDRNVNHYRLLDDDSWFIHTAQSPVFPASETESMTIEYTSPIQRCISVCSGIDTLGKISYSNGVVEFTDFAEKNLERRNWSSRAPKWRMAKPGLCVEGKCTNENCDATGKLVIVSMGFCSFTLPEDVYKCKCPLCSKNVKPITCGFNNCRWKWTGKKLEPLPNPPSVHRNKEWKVADDAYHIFKPHSTASDEGKAQWLMLTIFAQDSKKEVIICKVCATSSSQGIVEYPCGHKMHIFCAKQLPHQVDLSNANSYCPECCLKDLSTKRMGFSNFDKQ